MAKQGANFRVEEYAIESAKMIAEDLGFVYAGKGSIGQLVTAIGRREIICVERSVYDNLLKALYRLKGDRVE